MAGRKNYYYRQKVTEAELDAGFELLEQADRALSLDNDLIGVVQNGIVSEKSGTPDLSVDITGSSVVYNKDGERIAWGAAQNVDVSVDESSVSTAVAGGLNEKVVTIFAKFARVLADPRIDGNSLTVYFDSAEGFEFVVRQSVTEAPSPSPPDPDDDHIILADIRRTFGQTQIENTHISGPTGTWVPSFGNRREDAFVITQGATTLRAGTPEEIAQALFTQLAASANLVFTPSATWADSNPLTSTTVETAINEIVSDLAAVTGGTLIGGGVSATWENSDTIAGATLDAILEEVVDELAAKDAADDCGADRVGCFGAGTSVAFSTGSVQEALTSLGNGAGGLSVANAWTGANTFTNIGASTVQAALTFDTGSSISIVPDPFTIAIPTDGVLTIEDGSATPFFQIEADLEEIYMTNTPVYVNELRWLSTISNANIRQPQRTGTGANAGASINLLAQQGQSQTGAAANNDGGNIEFFPGPPGTGGSGAAGEYGHYEYTRDASSKTREYFRRFNISGTGTYNFDAPEGDLKAGESAYYEIQLMTIRDPVQTGTPSYWHEVAYSACQRDTGSTMLHAGDTVHDGGSKPEAEVAIGYTNNGNTPRLTFTGADGGTTKSVQVSVRETRMPAP